MAKILNYPAEPSHIINYIDTDTFQFFIYWLRDKMIEENEFDDRHIINILLSAVFSPHKYNKEFQKYLKYREEEL